MRPRGQCRLRDMAHDRLTIQFGHELGFVRRPTESLRLAGGEDDCCNLPHLRRLLHRATSFAPRRDDFGNDRDADFGRTRGADGKPYGTMDLGEPGLGKTGRAHPFEAPCVGYFGAERADIKAFRAQGRAERWVVDPRHMGKHGNRRITIKSQSRQRDFGPFGGNWRFGKSLRRRESGARIDNRHLEAGPAATASVCAISVYGGDRPAVSRPGDLWILGRHRLICGDARDANAYSTLLGNESVNLIFTDPPYNVPIDGHVCGSGRIRHREFAMGVGEMDKASFTRFLVDTLTLAAARCQDGAIAFVCMDWRHMAELLAAGEKVFAELKNLCVWNKTNGGMGTFYRSKHELVFVFKVGSAPHLNTFGLGDTGRYRTNVWDYPGVNSFRAGRMEELALHPTVKPAALVADAIKDCSRRGDIVLDPFGGSGTTLIAAQKSGRRARLIEYDPAYCDVILRRFEATTGDRATLAENGQSFEDVAEQRIGSPDNTKSNRGDQNPELHGVVSQ